jgi:uncharacterized phage protein (TIGR01671 family)
MNNRIIKFRVWDEIGKNMYYPDGDISLNNQIAGNYLIIKQPLQENIGWLENEDIIISQFTGLLDKNGKEIYEGDIVKNIHFEEKYEVVYNINTASFELWDNNFRLNAMDIWGNKNIIGNIYENPELLNSK